MENKKFLDLGGLEHYNDKVQAKLDAKVNSSSMSDYYTKSQTDANIATEAAARQSADAGLQTQISAIGNGSPLVASSVAGMTDTSKVYVNTTDGKWYYYDGDSWEPGGDFQSAVIGEDTVAPYMTKFLETKNLLPYTGWIEGKVWSWTTGAEMNYANGCLHNEVIAVTPGEVLLVINSSVLPIDGYNIVEYAADDSFVKNNTCGWNNHIQRLVISENTSYIKFCSVNNKFSVLPTNSIMIVRLSDVKDVINFNSVFEWSKGSRQSILSDEIVVSNKYGHKLIPRLYKSGTISLDINNFVLPNPYKFQYTGTVTGTSQTATVNLGCYVYADNVTTDDYLYVDFSEMTSIPTYVNTFIGTTGQGYMEVLGDGLFRIKLTDSIIAGLESANFYFFGYWYNQTVGDSLTVKASTYINSDYSDITKFLKTDNVEAPIKMIFLGDSITHLSGDRSWTTKFNSIINGTTIANVAVDGARLRDYETTVYDGNPTQSVPSSNVLGNQVQKILNDNYEAPDAIIIAIGTNGGIELNDGDLQNAFFTSNGVKDIADVDRQIDAGAYRWCTQKLNEKYPNAKIIWCTPIQGAYANNKRPNVVGPWGDHLKEFCLWGSTYCFDTEKCGINALNASVNLYDGLHPDVAGAKLIAQYNAGEFMKIASVIRQS